MCTVATTCKYVLGVGGKKTKTTFRKFKNSNRGCGIFEILNFDVLLILFFN